MTQDSIHVFTGNGCVAAIKKNTLSKGGRIGSLSWTLKDNGNLRGIARTTGEWPLPISAPYRGRMESLQLIEVIDYTDRLSHWLVMSERTRDVWEGEFFGEKKGAIATFFNLVSQNQMRVLEYHKMIEMEGYGE